MSQTFIDKALIVSGAVLTTRRGLKAVVADVLTDVAVVFIKIGTPGPNTWERVNLYSHGRYHRELTMSHDFDLVGLWIEKPIIDRSALPKWAKFVARDGRVDGDNLDGWYYYSEKPLLDSTYWNGGKYYGVIPREYAPKFAGDWKDSLFDLDEVAK